MVGTNMAKKLADKRAAIGTVTNQLIAIFPATIKKVTTALKEQYCTCVSVQLPVPHATDCSVFSPTFVVKCVTYPMLITAPIEQCVVDTGN